MERSIIKDQEDAFLLEQEILASEQYLVQAQSVYLPTSFGHQLHALPLNNPVNFFLKRMVDILLSSLLIILLFPWLVPLFSIFIKLGSKGPVFFLQERNKMDGKIFTCIKFRSMVSRQDVDQKAATAEDERVTKFGKFMRYHHFDELPQLLNVWMGEMSLIGPRPHMLTDNEKFALLVPHYNDRHKVKPGITGLAQVHGYVGPVQEVENIRQRVEQDLHYVKNWSIAMDTKIACRTVIKMMWNKKLRTV